MSFHWVTDVYLWLYLILMDKFESVVLENREVEYMEKNFAAFILRSFNFIITWILKYKIADGLVWSGL